MWHATATGAMIAPVRWLSRGRRPRARVSASLPVARAVPSVSTSRLPGMSRRRARDNSRPLRLRAAAQRYSPWVDPDDGPVAEDAPVRIDRPVGYSWGDELDNLRIDEDERARAARKWQEGAYVPDDDDDDEMYEPSPDGDTLYGKGPSSKRLRWPPSLGHGTVPRIARSLWALVAVVGVVWAVWSSVKHVMFLDFSTLDFGNLGAAIDAAALEALAGLAEGALVSTVVAPVVAALTAGFFELNLRFLTIMTGANLPRTLAPATAKTVADRERRLKAMKESRPQHLAYAKLKKATFSACEARHAAAAHACAAWSRPVVAVILGLAVWLTAVAVSGGFGAFVGLEQAIVGGPGPGRGPLTTAGVAVWYVVGAALATATSCLRRRPGAYAADARKEMERREREHLDGLHKGKFLCQWRSDDYVAPGERNKVNPDKQLTNRVVAAAAVGAAAHRRLPPSDAAALVLDASDAKTSEKLSTAFSYFGVGGSDQANGSKGPAGRFMSWLTSPMAPVDEPVEGEYSYGVVYDSMSNSFDSLDEDEEDDSLSFDSEGTEDFEEFEGKVVQAAPYLRGSVELGRRGKGANNWRYWWDNVKMKASKRVAAARGAYRAGATKADLEREALELNEGLGFPATSVLVPNQHTHVVHSLREPGSPCTPYAADVAEVLRKRDPKAPPLNLVYLDHCGAVKQREQQLWDVFSRHSVADGGVLAVTFSTRGKRLGWSKAAAVAACARALVEAADAHGYELEGGAADGALEPNYLERLMDYTVHFGDSVAPSSSSEEDEDPNESPEYRQTTTTVAESDGVAAAAASLRAHRSAVDAALREYTRQCELLGGVEAAFSEVARVNPAETEANRAAALAARALANALVVWADDVPASKDGRVVSFDTWASRRRRRLCRYLHSRVSGEEWDRVSPPTREDARLLQSLGREVVKSAGKAADLAQPAVAKGVEWRKLEGDIKGELTYPRCFFLYNSLMFFIFRVRVKRRVRKGKEERTFEDRLKLAPR